MDHLQTHSITVLVVFQNTINKELIRSLHVYRLEGGKENEVERLFVFKKNGSYVEMAANPVLRLQGFKVSELLEGRLVGLWLCIFAFHAHHLPRFFHIPSLLSFSRNPKLKSIPTLANDLKMILELSSRTEDKEPSHVSSKEMCGSDRENFHGAKRSLPVFNQDLNCLPYSPATSESSKNQETEQTATGMMVKKKRAASEDIARIALEDLAKYFDLPIAEASRNLNVGLTVLKKKCREFGIPRWPHRKIKSLDGLIRDLQEEAEQQEEKNKAAAMAVATRQKMLEKEKENIEMKPFMEIQSETKRFRQDIFKKRHRARAHKNQDLSTSSNVEQ